MLSFLQNHGGSPQASANVGESRGNRKPSRGQTTGRAACPPGAAPLAASCGPGGDGQQAGNGLVFTEHKCLHADVDSFGAD